MPWNNLSVCRRLIAKHGANLAAVIVDVLPTNLGLIAPRQGFLDLLREIEVVTGDVGEERVDEMQSAQFVTGEAGGGHS